MHMYVYCSTIHNSKVGWNQPKCPSMIDQIKKMWSIYTMEYSAAVKRNVIMSFERTWMELEVLILSKRTHKQKNKHHMFTCKWELNSENP